VGNVLQDLRCGLRALAKDPGVTAVAVIALALGIGGNTVMFSSVEATLLRPFALQDSDRTVAVWETVPQHNQEHISATPANFRDWREQSKAFDMLAAGHGWDVNLTGRDVAERVEGYQVTADYFAAMGIPAQLGRSIAADSFGPGRASVVVLSYGFWQRHLGGLRFSRRRRSLGSPRLHRSGTGRPHKPLRAGRRPLEARSLHLAGTG